ncbi:UMP-CMP kinase 4-like [Typha angustifolia]|uniref:UMP-CMP kinase 4-like n=1 Tax=Typha angustifolia TaxID=59011 RepID=UPI003C2C9512
MIDHCKKEGKIVPAEVTVALLQMAMQRSKNKKFLIDGFPRNEDNRLAFENIIKIEPDFVLFFDCPKEELTRRLLHRNQIDADRPVDEVFDAVKNVFNKLKPDAEEIKP